MDDPRNGPLPGSCEVAGVGACPTPSQLEDLADHAETASCGAASDDPAMRHLDGCAACRAAVAEIRSNRRFVAGVAEALRSVAQERSAPQQAADADLAPPGLPGYRSIDVIGHGAQAVVHRALHEASGRVVAVKSIRFGSRRQRARLAREARLAATLRHDGIVSVYDCGELREGGFAIVMELVEGVPLGVWAARARRGDPDGSPSSPIDARRRIARLFVRLCDAVAHAHRHGVIHRDLKPGNVLVGADEQPRVLDFGLAHSTDDAERDGPDGAWSLTRSGEFTGTLAYAAPEILAGGASRTGALGDVYALGVMLHEAIVGRTPHADAATVDGLVRAVVDHDAPRPVRDVEGRSIDADLATIILKAVARSPARRYDSPSALGRDLDNWITRQPIEARRDSLAYLARVFVRRHRVAVAAAMAMSGLLVGGSIALALLYRAAEMAHADARRSASNYANQLFERNIEQSIQLAIAGRLGPAEELAWREALSPSLPEAIGAPSTDPNFHAILWGLRQLASANPCLATAVVGAANAAAVVVRRTADGDAEVVVAWNDGAVTGLRSEDLAVTWSLRLPDAHPGLPSRLAVDGGAGRLAACVDGRRIWEIGADPAPRLIRDDGPGGDPLHQLSFDAGSLWACHVSGRCLKLDPATGERLWTAVAPPIDPEGPATDVVDGVFVCAAEGGPDLVAVDLAERGADGRAIGIGRLAGDGTWTLGGIDPCALGGDGVVLAYRRGLELWNPRRGSVVQLGDRFGGVRRVLLRPEAMGRRDAARDRIGVAEAMASDAADADTGFDAAVVLDDGGVRLFDLVRPPRSTSLSGHAARNLSPCAVAWIDADTLVSAGAAGVVRTWDARPGRWLRIEPAHGASIGRLWPSPDGTMLRSFGRDGTLRTWPLASGAAGDAPAAGSALPPAGRSTLLRLPGREAARRAAFSPDGGLVAIDDRDDPPRIVVRRMSDLAVVAEHPAVAPAGPLDFSPDGRWLAAGLGIGEGGPALGVCDLHGGGGWRTLEAGALPSTFTRVLRCSNGGDLVAWGLSDGRLYLVGLGATALPEPIHLRGAVRSLVFSPDDARLLTSHDDGHVVMHDLRTGEILVDVAAHAKVASAVAWSPDGNMFASADYGGEAAIWCAMTHRRCASLHLEGAPIHTIVFGPAGDRLFIGDERGRVGEWTFGRYDVAVARSVEAWIELLGRDGIATPNGAALRAWADARRGAP